MQTRELASRWQRLGGALIDSISQGLLMMALALILVIILGLALGLDEARRFIEQLVARGRNPDLDLFTAAEVMLSLLFSFLTYIAINGYLLSTSGQTIGKRLVGTRIVDMQGHLKPLGTVLGIRFAFYAIIPYLPFIGWLLGLANLLFIFRRDKRCIHDLVAGTQVVKA